MVIIDNHTVLDYRLHDTMKGKIGPQKAVPNDYGKDGPVLGLVSAFGEASSAIRFICDTLAQGLADWRSSACNTCNVTRIGFLYVRSENHQKVGPHFNQ